MTKMAEEFQHTYLHLCKDHHIEAQDSVINQLKSAKMNPQKGGLTLNLSTHSLTVKTCAVLAKALATDRAFSEVKFNDCMLAEEAVKAIAYGMASNVACRKLELKGNNIRGTATEALGRMLRQNKTITSIVLEWNAMGMLDNAFSVFCEGLGANNTLKVLDLRSNQISHDGASELAGALKRNTILKVLDLRWNNVGLIGGRALLNSLQHNKTITKLELAGNNTPQDIARSIETALGHNLDRGSLQNDYETRTKMLSQELHNVQREKQREMVDLLDQLDHQDTLLRKSNRSATHRIGQLQEALEERKSQFNSMAAKSSDRKIQLLKYALEDGRSQFHTVASKLSLTESELALAEAKANDLSHLMGRTKQEAEHLQEQHQKDLRREREERANQESKLIKELNEVNESNIQLINKVDELERKCKTQQENIYELKEQLAHNQAEVKMKAAGFDERIQMEKQKHREALRDAEDIKQKEIARVKHESEETEKNLKDRIQKLEMQRIELEEEISRHKTSMTAEKLACEETLMMTKQKIKNEDEQRCRQLEDKIRILQTSKDDLEQHCSQQAALVSELQTKNANLVLEAETLKRRLEEVNQELAGKNNEMMAEVGKVKIEMNARINKLESERKTQAELIDRITELERSSAEQTSKYRTTVEEKENEISRLSDKLRSRESEISQMREEDAQRANMLQSAIQSYVTRSPFVPR